MLRFLARKNDVDLTRLATADALESADTLYVEKVGSLRRKVTFGNMMSAVAAGILNTIVPAGVITPWLTTTAPTGWVLASGRTIGGEDSGATELADDSTAALYALLWQSFSNTELIIQDSAGTPTTRGTSAANDFAANKRLPLPDLRDRAIVGLGNMGGTAINRVTAYDTDTIGKAGGAESLVLVTANIPQHTHDVAVPTTVAASAATGTDVAIPGAASDITSTTYGSASPTAISVVQPSIALPYIIKL